MGQPGSGAPEGQLKGQSETQASAPEQNDGNNKRWQS